MRLRHFFALTAVVVLLIGSGCSMDYRSKDDGGGASSNDGAASRLATIQYLRSSDIDIRAELITDRNGDNVLAVSREESEYMYYKFTKRGNADGDDADTSGTNAAVLADDSASLKIIDSLIFSSGDHAHGLFSLGEGTVAVLSDCVVSTLGNNSSAVMTSGVGSAELHHVTAETFGTSSPALRVTDDGGAITAERGKLSTSGTDSPAILSEGAISVSEAKIETEASSAVVIEGSGSVTLTSCDVSSSKSAVFIYMDSAGNSATNSGTFTMINGSLTCDDGELFYVSNATANISLTNTDVDTNGTFLRAEASSWGTAGVNGGKITLNAENQDIDGDIYLDGVSDMNMYLNENAYFTGAINPSGTNARIYVSINNSKWVLTGDSHIDSLTCGTDSITLNGHNLYVDGAVYEAGTDSSGSEINFNADRVSKDKSSDNTSDDGDGESGGDESGEDGGDESGETVESEDKTLSFDVLVYTTGTVNGVAYRAYSDIVYVSEPVISDCQKLSVYIPEPYFSSRPVNGYTADTAPIFIPNDSGGYMAASIMTPQDTNPVGLAISRGLVVVSPALRGRNVSGGSAPAAIVDYKAAVKYIRANKSRLPAGNTDRIIACGVSSGGALSALLGVTGNSPEYDSWLDEIGAADAEDHIFAAVSYCPVTSLENADGAYEFIFGGEKYGEDSVAMIDEFESYFNSLSLTHGDVDLQIYEYDPEYEEGQTFRRYLEGLYVQAAQSAVASGAAVSADWIALKGESVVSADLRKYADSFAVRQKGIPAFDKFDLSSPENSEFGYKHFTDYSAEHSTAGGEIADYSVIYVMNPVNHIGNADTCKFWRIRHGVNDRDVAIATPAVLALSLENAGCTVNFAAVWGQGHGGYYDTEELFAWIDSVCKE